MRFINYKCLLDTIKLNFRLPFVKYNVTKEFAITCGNWIAREKYMLRRLIKLKLSIWKLHWYNAPFKCMYISTTTRNIQKQDDHVDERFIKLSTAYIYKVSLGIFLNLAHPVSLLNDWSRSPVGYSLVRRVLKIYPIHPSIENMH